MHVLGRDRAWVYAHPELVLDAGTAERYFQRVARRIAGTPTQYLTGHQEFWGLDFEVEPAVLIPRPESEHVVEVALERLGQLQARRKLRPAPSRGLGSARLRVADVGTGSGCLAVALAHDLPEAEVFAIDISAAALGVAQRNAARHGLTPRIHFLQGNLLEPFAASAQGAPERAFDLVVSNPPYVGRGEADLLPSEVREHEPPEALFAGEQGCEIYDPLIAQAEKVLAGGGLLVLELGYNALERVLPLLDSRHVWINIGVTKDLAGLPRVLAAERV
jgi:release factor glutamine methyltransferase